jgi:hypothetical protein
MDLNAEPKGLLLDYILLNPCSHFKGHPIFSRKSSISCIISRGFSMTAKWPPYIYIAIGRFRQLDL